MMNSPVSNRGLDSPLRVVLLGFAGRDGVREQADRLSRLIRPAATIVASDLAGAADLSRIEADVAVVLGGDGSILRAAHQMGNRQLPVIAVNLGKLGFLADLKPEEVPGVLADFGAGRLAVVEHLMLHCELWRDGAILAKQLGLNEVAVFGGEPFTILDVDLYVDGELVTTYSCDGLIVATPVGSTAHSLSAGGPILRKDLQAVVVSPISPHTLTHRPVVDAADRVYELVVNRPSRQTSVVVDGRVLGTLAPGDRVRVVRANEQFKLVTAPGHSYYQTLREKLHWSGRLPLDGKPC
ncbi:MAG: NAD(+)/NADH kinase [Pirellulales bacterium]|nr:NAD(+)/NADH kinase [Pirellulales bacterium]